MKRYAEHNACHVVVAQFITIIYRAHASVEGHTFKSLWATQTVPDMLMGGAQGWVSRKAGVLGRIEDESE